MTEPDARPWIYLDSSDISILADTRTPEIVEIKRTLLSKVSEEKIYIPISFWHIAECAQLNSSVKDAAVRRATLLGDLSAGKAFPYPFELWIREWSFFLKKGYIPKRGDIINANDHWFPEDTFTDIEIDIDPKDAIAKRLRASSLPRKQRRRFTSKMIRGEYMRPRFFEENPHIASQFADDMLRKIPLVGDMATSEFWIQWMTGKVNRGKMLEQLKSNMRDPVFVVDYAIERVSTKDGSIPVWLRSGGEKLRDIFFELQTRINLIVAQMGDVDLARLYMKKAFADGAAVKGIRRAIILATYELMKETANRLEISENDLQIIFDASNGNLPSLDLFIDAFEKYLMISVGQFKDSRRPRHSDLGDLFHMSLLPYCDVFRADAFMSDLARKLHGKSSPVIVPRLSNLLGVLQDLGNDCSASSAFT